MTSHSLYVAAYLIIANHIRGFDGRTIKSNEVYELMMCHSCWEFGPLTPHLKHMAEGDKLFFYLAGPGRQEIYGSAKIAGDPVPIDSSSPKTFDRDAVPFYAVRIPLNEIVRYDQRPDLDVVARLSFAVNSPVERKYIGLLLRHGVRRLADTDVGLIEGEAKLSHSKPARTLS